MDFFQLFKKQPEINVLLRCTYCDFEYDADQGDISYISQLHKNDSVCTIKSECDICHTGFMIPVNYTDKNGKTYRFDELKTKIKNLDPDTSLERWYS